jgi:SAM-dependent methyltransferase
MPSWDIRQIALCEKKGIPVPKDAKILDYGCGAGRRVYELLDAGYCHAYGYDVLEYLELRAPTDRDHFYIASDGHIPVPDATFDFVFSDAVFEHVMNQPLAWQEIVRVLKPGGVSVHVIPAKWQVIEPHIKVPFGGLEIFKRYPYYLLWAILGVRNEFQHGRSARDVARRNYDYAQKDLNYWSSRQYRRLFQTLPITWSWEEVAYMEASYKPGIRRLAKLAHWVPLVTIMIRTFWARMLFLVKHNEAKKNNTVSIGFEVQRRAPAFNPDRDARPVKIGLLAAFLAATHFPGQLLILVY